MANAAVTSGPGGGSRWISRIPEIIAQTPVRALAVADAITKETAAGAAANAPVATGTLKDSIEGGALERGEDAAVVAVWYWFLVEFGSSNKGARPFMLPAYEVALASLPRISKEVFAGL